MKSVKKNTFSCYHFFSPRRTFLLLFCEQFLTMIDGYMMTFSPFRNYYNQEGENNNKIELTVWTLTLRGAFFPCQFLYSISKVLVFLNFLAAEEDLSPFSGTYPLPHGEYYVIRSLLVALWTSSCGNYDELFFFRHFFRNFFPPEHPFQNDSKKVLSVYNP